MRRHKYTKDGPKGNNVCTIVQRIRNNDGTLHRRDLNSELVKGFKCKDRESPWAIAKAKQYI